MWWICQNMGDIMGFNIECFSPKISEHHDQLWHLGMAVFSDISNVRRFTRNQWRRRILAATLPCFARKSTMISLIGALTISHFKLTQHCTSNLPQSSQHVKCNADCWSAFLNPTAWPLVVYRELLQSEITTGYSRCVVPCFWPGNNQTADHVGKKFMGKKSRMRLPWCFPRIFPIFTRFPNFLSTVGG